MSHVPGGIGASWLDQNLNRVGQLTGFGMLGFRHQRSSGMSTSSGGAVVGATNDSSYFVGTDTSGGSHALVTTVNGASWGISNTTNTTSVYGGRTSTGGSFNDAIAISYPVNTSKWAYFCRFNIVSLTGGGAVANTQFMSGACTVNADTAGWGLGFIYQIDGSDTTHYHGKLKNTAGTSTAISSVALTFNTWHTGLIFSDGAKAGLSIDGENIRYFGTFRTPDSTYLVPYRRTVSGAGRSTATMYVSQAVYCWDAS